jgi:hypothetical protein
LTKVDDHRAALRKLDDWDPYLLANSALPGPRANLELVQAAADEGDEARFRHLLGFDATLAPANSAAEFLAVCGAVGLGKLLAAGRGDVLDELRALAADPRWRVREGVAMALQRWGDVDMPALVDEMTGWCRGSAWEQRAAMAALCEPRLLRDSTQARRVLRLLDAMMAGVRDSDERRSEAFRVLRQALGYGWSVVAVAVPAEGKAAMARWCESTDPDVRWILRENLKKKRLARMDPAWVSAMLRST